MTESGEIDLALGLLDHQLVDADGRRCGKVDDLQLEEDGSGLRVAAVVVGGSARAERGRIGALIARVAGDRAVVVPWSEVSGVDSAVRLRRPARELRLGRGDDRARRLVERIPGAQR